MNIDNNNKNCWSKIFLDPEPTLKKTVLYLIIDQVLRFFGSVGSGSASLVNKVHGLSIYKTRGS